MGLSSHKFIETDFTGKKIADLSDTPSSDGMTAAQLKEYFDYIPKAMIALGAINDIIDDLCATSGAEDIGASVPGVTGTNIQAVLESLKGLVDDRYTKSAVDTLLTGKASTSTVSGMIASVDFDEETGTFTFTEQGGTTHTFDTGLEKVVTNWDYDEETQKLVLILESGETKSVDLSAFVTTNEFLDSDTIKFSVAGEKVKAAIKEGSITDAMLQQSLLTLLQGYAASCKQNAESAETSKTNAGEYSNAAASSATSATQSATIAGEKATVASQKATAAENSQILAQSYAKGGTGTRTGEDTDNAKYYMEQAKAAAGGDFATRTELTEGLETKVDKASGKQLSTNDYTTADKDKVANLPSNTNTELEKKVDKVSGKGLSANDYTTTDKNKVANLPSDTNTELAKKGNAALITETNTSVPVSAWASDTTYTDFPFRAGITITGCTANHKPDVTFSLTDAVSGNYAPIAESYAGGIYIYAAEKPTAALTIPTISLLQEVEA